MYQKGGKKQIMKERKNIHQGEYNKLKSKVRLLYKYSEKIRKYYARMFRSIYSKQYKLFAPYFD